MRGIAWRLYLGTGALATGAHHLLPEAGGAVLNVVVDASAVAAIAGGIRWHRPARRLAWWLIAAAQGLFVVARRRRRPPGHVPDHDGGVARPAEGQGRGSSRSSDPALALATQSSSFPAATVTGMRRAELVPSRSWPVTRLDTGSTRQSTSAVPGSVLAPVTQTDPAATTTW
jgi:hypothetical protein